jgi:hypothetical protein
MRSRLCTGCGLVIVLLALAGCGSSANGSASPPTRGAQPAPHTTSFVPGKFQTVPLLPRMRATGNATRTGPVTERTYRMPTETPRYTIAAYANLLRSWRVVVPHQRVGKNTYQGVWEKARYNLVVTTTPAPLLAGPASTTTQVSLELYDPGAPPSTLPPG